MKKILLFCIAALLCFAAQAQPKNQLTAKPITYSLSTNDTMQIFRANDIAGVTVFVPSGATDSVWVKGGTATLDGHASGYIKLPPGDFIGFGYNDEIRLDSVTIIVKNKATVITTPLKKK